jgi:hypothetical protein
MYITVVIYALYQGTSPKTIWMSSRSDLTCGLDMSPTIYRYKHDYRLVSLLVEMVLDQYTKYDTERNKPSPGLELCDKLHFRTRALIKRVNNHQPISVCELDLVHWTKVYTRICCLLDPNLICLRLILLRIWLVLLLGAGRKLCSETFWNNNKIELDTWNEDDCYKQTRLSFGQPLSRNGIGSIHKIRYGKK